MINDISYITIINTSIASFSSFITIIYLSIIKSPNSGLQTLLHIFKSYLIQSLSYLSKSESEYYSYLLDYD